MTLSGKNVLVTGANGFIGDCDGSVCGRWLRCYRGCASSHWRKLGAPSPSLGNDADWWPLLAGKTVVVHTAARARAHVLNDRVADPLAEFRRVNVTGTLRLAEQAAEMGVRLFVFVSSIGVNEVQSAPGKAFLEADQPNPHNAYALSKWEAEQGLLRIADKTGLEVVIIRPPLVYGRNAPGNFGSPMRAVQRGWPLPLGAVHNQRSLVALSNLVDFIVTCITHPQAANQTFLVSDGQDLSTTELVRGMAQQASRGACAFAASAGVGFAGGGNAAGQG